MSSLKKRGSRYYIKFTKTVNGKTREKVKTLSTDSRERVKKGKAILDKRAAKGQDPFSKAFNWDYRPKKYGDPLRNATVWPPDDSADSTRAGGPSL